MTLRLGIGKKLAIIYALAAMLSIIIVTIATIGIMSSEIEKEVTQKLETDTIHKMEMINTFIFERLSDMKIILFQLSDNQIVDERLIEEIKIWEKQKKFYRASSIYALDGIRIANTEGFNIGINDSDAPFFQEAAKERVYHDPRPIFSKYLNTSVIHFSGPLYNSEGKLSGIFATNIPQKYFIELIDENTNDGLERYLLDKDGLILFTNTDRSLILRKRMSGLEIFKEMKATSATTATIKANHQAQTAIYSATIQKSENDGASSDWMLITKIDEPVAFHLIEKLKRRFQISGIIVLFLVIPISFIFSRTISAPLIELKNATEKIGRGDLNSKVNIKTGDEVEDVADAFNKMASDLKKYQKKLSFEQEFRSKILKKEIAVKTKDLSNALKNIQTANRKLRELDEAKGEFLNLVSHELKTPITPIKANLDLLMDNDLGKVNIKQKERLQIIDRNIMHLNGLILNLLEIARVDAGKIVLESTDEDLNDIAKEAVEDIKLAASEKNISIKTDFSALSKASIDRRRIKECISNYLENALKFTKKGSIIVSTRMKNGLAKLSVTDTGAGIDPKCISRLFQKFYQIGKTEKGKPKGVGLGLYSVKKIVELHNGKVGVSQNKPRGSSFWFLIPTNKNRKGDKNEKNNIC